MKQQFEYIIEPDGSIPSGVQSEINLILRKYAGKKMIQILTNERKRSIPQNSWFHAINKLITDYLRETEKERGNENYYQINEETTKLWIKQKFLGYEEINGERHLRKTRNLKTFEMNQLYVNLQTYFSPLGLYLPDPNQTNF